jgi:hypothetical protein
MAQPGGNDWQLIEPGPIEGDTPPELSTGDPEDDELLRHIAARSRLDQPREVKHFLYVRDEEAAQTVARPLAMTGWEAEIFAPEATGEPYLVTAARDRVVLTAELVRSSRELFQSIVSAVPGSEYDGWEASIPVSEDAKG